MGLPMASRLVEAGYEVQGWDVSAAARDAFGAAVGALAEAAAGASATVLMLPDSAVVRQVLLGDGLLDAVAPGALVVDMSSSQPVETRALAKAAAALGVRFVDAPVSGGVRGAEAGTLTIMAGGPEQDVAASAPLFDVLGSKVVHAGAVGAGHALKALNNLLSATTLLITCEAVLVAERFGLDPEVFVAAVNDSTGRSYSTDVKLPDYILPGTFDSGFGLQLMVKDLQTALALAETTGSALRLGATSAELWERSSAELPEDADHTEIARWLGLQD
jgi:3-hydroxyisobutyrate dehydrogenase